MLTAGDVYEQVCAVLLQEGGLREDYTDQQFFSDLNEILIDWHTRTGLTRAMESIEPTGADSYQVPESIAELGDVLFDLRYLLRSDLASVQMTSGTWLERVGKPDVWYEDASQPRRFSLWPRPPAGGTPVNAQPLYGTIGADTDLFDVAGPFYGTIADISGEVFVNGAMLGVVSNVTWAAKNITVIGSAAPFTKIGSATDPIPTVPDDFLPYVVFGVLWRVFASAGELRDPLRAAYCSARYEEGVALARSITGHNAS